MVPYAHVRAPTRAFKGEGGTHKGSVHGKALILPTVFHCLPSLVPAPLRSECRCFCAKGKRREGGGGQLRGTHGKFWLEHVRGPGQVGLLPTLSLLCPSKLL